MPRVGWWFGPGFALLLGCVTPHQRMERSLLGDRNPAAHARDLHQHYRVYFPDQLVIDVAGRPDCSGKRTVALDGRVPLTPLLAVPVDGRRTPEIARLIARRLAVPAEAVRVEVANYRSQQLVLIGEVGARQVVDYRGPETVVDLLQRVGGLQPGADVDDVRVVRAHVADGNPPEVFHVDLTAILRKGDLQTNVRLQPGDHVHIGQTRSSQVACYLPPCLHWLWQGKRRPPLSPP
ncbi:MAG: hypothetical protein U0736_00930 [Gemmataceae bacterium]